MTTAKKTTAKKSTAAKKTTKSDSEDTTEDTAPSSVQEVAKEVIEGKWFSGRDRDILLADAGFDPRAVQTEVARQLSER